MENKEELSMRMPSGFPVRRRTPPADVEHSQYKAAWHEAMKIELDSHVTI